jgi:hypothetical protein
MKVLPDGGLRTAKYDFTDPDKLDYRPNARSGHIQ